MRNQAYKKGQKVKVDPGVFVASPTLGQPTIEAEVLADTPADAVQVYLSRCNNGDTLYVFKHRVEP